MKLLGKCCRGASTRPQTRDSISVHGAEQSTFFNVKVCHPNAYSYKNLTTEQIYKLHENDKKRLYSSRVLEVERGTFTLLFLITLEAYLTNVNFTTVDLLSYWQ